MNAPQQGEDVTVLWRHVAALYQRIEALENVEISIASIPVRVEVLDLNRNRIGTGDGQASGRGTITTESGRSSVTIR